MTDMSHPCLASADAFGGLDHLVPPGQDPALLLGIHAALVAELAPANFIERMWVRDMAIETARVEYLRMADCALQRLVQEEAKEKEAPEGAEDADDESAPLPADRVLARAFAGHMALISALIHLEQTVIHERDRLIHQYDTRTGIVRAYNDAIAALDRHDQDHG